MSQEAFACKGCTPPKIAFCESTRPINSRPNCRRCGMKFSEAMDLFWANREGSTVTEETITPTQALTWLLDANPIEGPNDPDKVRRYSELMSSGKWTYVPLSDGGIYNPIVFDHTGRVRYGLQRLEACTISNTPFQSVIIRWPLTNPTEVSHASDAS